MTKNRRRSAVLLLTLATLGFSLSPQPALANKRDCQPLEQRYLQIKTAASSIERNALLFSAADKECEALARQLLDDGASLEARDRSGNMPLAIAAKNGHTGIVSLFLERKAPVDARNVAASTALFMAIEEERAAATGILLKAGADPNIAGRSGIAPIGAAAYTGNAAVVAILLSKGADPKAVDATGKTAIIYAAGRGYKAVVKQLLDQGIDSNARYGNDLTALIWAAGHSEEVGAADVKETIELLIANSARLNDADDRGRTALMTASELGHTTALETLLKAGADVSLTDKAGKTAADLASDDAIRTQLASR